MSGTTSPQLPTPAVLQQPRPTATLCKIGDLRAAMTNIDVNWHAHDMVTLVESNITKCLQTKAIWLQANHSEMEIDLQLCQVLLGTIPSTLTAELLMFQQEAIKKTAVETQKTVTEVKTSGHRTLAAILHAYRHTFTEDNYIQYYMHIQLSMCNFQTFAASAYGLSNPEMAPARYVSDRYTVVSRLRMEPERQLQDLKSQLTPAVWHDFLGVLNECGGLTELATSLPQAVVKYCNDLGMFQLNTVVDLSRFRKAYFPTNNRGSMSSGPMNRPNQRTTSNGRSVNSRFGSSSYTNKYDHDYSSVNNDRFRHQYAPYQASSHLSSNSYRRPSIYRGSGSYTNASHQVNRSYTTPSNNTCVNRNNTNNSFRPIVPPRNGNGSRPVVSSLFTAMENGMSARDIARTVDTWHPGLHVQHHPGEYALVKSLRDGTWSGREPCVYHSLYTVPSTHSNEQCRTVTNRRYHERYHDVQQRLQRENYYGKPLNTPRVNFATIAAEATSKASPILRSPTPIYHSPTPSPTSAMEVDDERTVIHTMSTVLTNSLPTVNTKLSMCTDTSSILNVNTVTNTIASLSLDTTVNAEIPPAKETTVDSVTVDEPIIESTNDEVNKEETETYELLDYEYEGYEETETEVQQN